MHVLSYPALYCEWLQVKKVLTVWESKKLVQPTTLKLAKEVRSCWLQLMSVCAVCLSSTYA